MELTLTPAYRAGIDREWDRLASPGTWWTGAERVALAAVARAARVGAELPVTNLPATAVEAAARFSADPHVDLAWVEDLERQGLERPAYVEILGVVARLDAVDTFLFGIGAPARPLPDPRPGDPSGAPVLAARIDDGFVPTVGQAFAHNALSAVAAEQEAQYDLHGVLYMTMEEMGDLALVRDLDRVQIEFVAARTSLLNDCFF
jgi:hypothetical protein